MASSSSSTNGLRHPWPLEPAQRRDTAIKNKQWHSQAPVLALIEAESTSSAWIPLCCCLCKLPSGVDYPYSKKRKIIYVCLAKSFDTANSSLSDWVSSICSLALEIHLEEHEPRISAAKTQCWQNSECPLRLLQRSFNLYSLPVYKL